MSVLAVVSKAVFEKEARSGRTLLGIGATWTTASYASENPALAALRSGGDLWLVTVRPGDVLWLVGVLRSPEAKSGGWSAEPNEVPIRDITALIPKLRFASGKGVTAAPGRLGMSLQTPRVLADGDLALLEAAAKGARGKGDAPPATAAVAYAGAVAATQAMKAAGAHAEKAAAAEGQPGLRIAARRAPFKALTREDKKLLAEVVEELADEEARPGVEVLDVVDAATGDRRYLFALWPYGSGVVVDVATKAIVADVCQHYLELRSRDRTLPERLAAAWHRDRDALGVREIVSFEQGKDNPTTDMPGTSKPAREEADAFAGSLALAVAIDGQSFPAGRLVSDAVHEVRPVEGVLEALLQVGAGKRIVLFAELARLPPRGDLTGAKAKPPKGAQAGSATCYGAHAERWVRFVGELGARMGGHAIGTARTILDERDDWAATWGPRLTANPSIGTPFWLEQCVALAVLARSAKRAGGVLDPAYDARLRVLADCFDASYALPPILEELPPERAGAIACGQIELVAKFPSPAGAAAAIARFEQWGGGPYYEKKLRAALAGTGPAAGPALEAAIAKGGPQTATLKKLLPKAKAKSR